MTTTKVFVLCACLWIFLGAFSAFANDGSAVKTVPVDLTSAADSVDEVKRGPASVDANAPNTAKTGDTVTAGTDYSVPDYIDDSKTIDREPRGAVESMPPRRN